MQMGINPGQLVQPKAGRDCGKYYLVLKVIDDNYVFAADGTVRRLENPKKKNIKHLILHSKIAGEIVDKLRSGERISNIDIRRAIERLVDNAEELPF
ncbi:KOW domain-containing RNA-binding protein [Desulfoscipio sp. XC116]|uniref:KOW domain-containing RNA-binding protein n=1 Tax=Desulfoscipio sp. XC116 TaxID=3144975 RepID=UPI00325AEDE5